MDVQGVFTKATHVTVWTRHSKVQVFLAGQNVSGDAGDRGKCVSTSIPPAQVFAPRILRRNFWVNFVQVAFDHRYERALALRTRKAENMAASAVAPLTSALLIHPLRAGSSVAEVVIRPVRVVNIDVHAG